MKLTPELLKGVTDYVKGAQELVQAEAAERQKIAEAAPAAVDALIKAGAVDPAGRELAIKQLTEEPHRAVVSLQNMAERQMKAAGATKQASLGQPAAPVNAGAPDPDWKVKKGEADRVFAEAFGFSTGA